ncbi:MepB family protein [Desertivirga brevis]|uniref:MepB family protein n=1 Tax=Desertivirga brevis TaxID=2810310 RepID=UPI001A96D7E5|nr:MepB family protein [Pedobacter sp. SYSU D00873]
MSTQNEVTGELKLVKEMVYDKCGFLITNIASSAESLEYQACSFSLNERKIIHRVSKITPTKLGQFVTIWKRNSDGKTEPFNVTDNFDFIAITCRKEDLLGQFIFSKATLSNEGIISTPEREGKRGIRVYPPWETVTNKQAKKTQSWQIKSFLKLEYDGYFDLQLVKSLLSES